MTSEGDRWRPWRRAIPRPRPPLNVRLTEGVWNAGGRARLRVYVGVVRLEPAQAPLHVRYGEVGRIGGDG
jgi:hypothetical protein